MEVYRNYKQVSDYFYINYVPFTSVKAIPTAIKNKASLCYRLLSYNLFKLHFSFMNDFLIFVLIIYD
jgi:hypothetical protein